MKIFGKSFRIIAGLALALPSFVLAQSADEIMRKSDESRRIPNLKAEAQISTTGDGAPSDKSFKFWRKLAGDGKRLLTLTRFTAPATVRDQAILFLERDSDSSDIFLYLPTFKKTRRVESHAQSGSFMGSAFSYSDIATPQAEDYKNTLVKSEKCPGSANNCFVIQSLPRTAGVKERSGYSKSIQWIDSVSYLPVKGEYYAAEGGKLKKTLQASKIENVVPKKHYFATLIEIVDVTSGRKSRLEFKKVSAKEGLGNNLFTQSALESP